MKYRADVDGLRAVAVIAVIINHLPGSLLPGGFLGVDVFFVISGYVVTASILGRKADGALRFYIDFLSRRVRRLWPALVVCVILTSAGVLAFDPFPDASIRTGISSLFGVANINLYLQQLDYFAASSKFNAFTHMWSLGVEEQFYVVFPLLLWWLVFGMRRDRIFLGKSLLVLSVLSLFAFAYFYPRNQPAAYFLMPMRFWELGLGAMAFLWPSGRPGDQTGRWASVPVLLSLLVLIGCFWVSEEHAVTTTMLAGVSTAALLRLGGDSFVYRWLSIRPIVYVGRLSYSLYLYHWPVVTLGPLALASEWRHPGLYLAAMFLLAMLSYHGIEHPLRKKRWIDGHWKDVLAGLLISAIVGIGIWQLRDFSGPERGEVMGQTHPPSHLPMPGKDVNWAQVCSFGPDRAVPTNDRFWACTTPPKAGSQRPTLWTVGDSHAGHLQGLLLPLHDYLGLGIHLTTTPGLPFPMLRNHPQLATRRAAREFLHARMLENALPGDIVIISRFYFKRTFPPVERPGVDNWLAMIPALADELAIQDIKLVVFGPTPLFDFADIRACDIEDEWSCSVQRSDIAPPIDRVLGKLKTLEARHDNIVVFDAFTPLCPAGSERCFPLENGIYTFRDADHLNVYGAGMLVTPFVEKLRSRNLFRVEN